MTIHIGKHYTGKPHSFQDTRTGEFWASLPEPGSENLRLQRALLTSQHTPRLSWLSKCRRFFAGA